MHQSRNSIVICRLQNYNFFYSERYSSYETCISVSAIHLIGAECVLLAKARSFPMEEALNRPDHLEYAFRRACSWSMFTLDRDNADWMYSTFIR